jgi:hypothetical protein
VIYTKSPLTNSLLHGKKDNDAEDFPFANEMKVTFFKSNRTGHYIKKPMILSFLTEEGVVVADGLWELSEFVDLKSKVVEIDLFCKGNENNVLKVMLRFEFVSESAPEVEGPRASMKKSLSIQNLNLNLRRMSLIGDRGDEKKKEEEKEKEKEKEEKAKEEKAKEHGGDVNVRIRELEALLKAKEKEIEELKKKLAKYEK